MEFVEKKGRQFLELHISISTWPTYLYTRYVTIVKHKITSIQGDTIISVLTLRIIQIHLNLHLIQLRFLDIHRENIRSAEDDNLEREININKNIILRFYIMFVYLPFRHGWYIVIDYSLPYFFQSKIFSKKKKISNFQNHKNYNKSKLFLPKYALNCVFYIHLC